MADNVNITPGSGEVVASDQIAGAQYQRVKVTWGADGTANDTSTTNPLPVYSTMTAIADGRKTVTTAGTRVTLAASTACKQVAITAFAANTGTIVVGGSTVVASAATRQGIPLSAGDTIAMDIDNLADIYLDATVNGEGVSFIYFT